MLNNKIKNKNIKLKKKNKPQLTWINLAKHPSHEIKITTYKANKKIS